MSIHPTAIIDPTAKLGENVEVGPYSIIEKGVTIGDGSIIKPHTIISGPSIICKNNTIGPFATIGAPPQDLKYEGEDSTLVIGDNNQIREYVSIHRGTGADRNETTVGSNNLLMGYVHVAHDCIVGNNIIMANGTTLAGHVEVFDNSILGGLVAVHQFSRIGAHSYIGGLSGINQDVPPFIIVSGTRNGMRVSGINKVGLRRKSFSNDDIRNLDKAYRIIFRNKDLLLKEALEEARGEFPDCEPVIHLIDFFRDSKQGVIRRTSQ